ncbi:hypothetical protein ISF97_27735 [Burkholderia pseudomallei]|nr:hypothetical protein [Burkholderia pseudomallei]
MPKHLARFISLIKSFLNWRMHSNISEGSDNRPADADAPVATGDAQITPPSPISRFIYESDKIRKQGNRPKPGVFMPEEYGNRWETSVCRIDTCDDERVWHLGRACRIDKTLRARIDFDVQQVVDNALACRMAPQDGYDEHAVVIQWPADKEQQKLIAVQLAAAVGVCRIAPPIVDGNATVH